LFFNGSTTVQVTTNDLGLTGAGGAQIDADAIDVFVDAVNDAPINSLPADQTSSEDSRLTLSAATGNGISVSDVDVGTSPLRVTLTATGGSLTLGSTTGLTFLVGDGTADVAMTFTGTRFNINAAVDTLWFDPLANFNGLATVQVVTNDQGFTGLGGELIDSDTLVINVIAVNDAPALSLPGEQTATEFGAVFSAAGGTAIAVQDLDGGLVQVTLSMSAGTLTLGATAGLTFLTGDGSADTAMTFSGSVADVNAALDGLLAKPDGLESTLSIEISDLGNTGAGGAQLASGAIGVVQMPLIPPPAPPADTTDTTDTDDDEDQRALPSPVLTQSEAGSHRTGETSASPAERRSASGVEIALAGPEQLLANIQRAVEAAEFEELSFGEWSQSEAAMLASRLAGGSRQLGYIDTGLLWSQLDSLAEQMESPEEVQDFAVGAVAGLTAMLSTGYLIWCLRGGSLLASALSSIPLWRSFDPLPILEFWERGGSQDDEDDDVLDERTLRNLIS
jgi:hypothetical protein